jgi:hypothetical protein
MDQSSEAKVEPRKFSRWEYAAAYFKLACIASPFLLILYKIAVWADRKFGLWNGIIEALKWIMGDR